jgi:transposase InsO family protein
LPLHFLILTVAGWLQRRAVGRAGVAGIATIGTPDTDVTTIKLPVKSPNLNAHAERFVLSIKSECLNHVVPLGEGHLRLLVTEFVEHYHLERSLQGLANALIVQRDATANDNGRVQRRKRIGGMLT